MSEFRITGPGVYLTRDGQEAEIYSRDDEDDAMQWEGDLNGTDYWGDEGNYWPSGRVDDYDLVAYLRPLPEGGEK